MKLNVYILEYSEIIVDWTAEHMPIENEEFEDAKIIARNQKDAIKAFMKMVGLTKKQEIFVTCECTEKDIQFPYVAE